jgi:hypothetical protein
MSAFTLPMLRRNNVKLNTPRSAAFTAIYDGICAHMRMTARTAMHCSFAGEAPE